MSQILETTGSSISSFCSSNKEKLRVILIAAVIFAFFSMLAFAESLRNIPFKTIYKTKEFTASFHPSYPVIIGQQITINIKTDLDAYGISIQPQGARAVDLEKKNQTWTGKFTLEDIGKEGWQTLNIFIKYHKPPPYKILGFLNLAGKEKDILIKRMWFRAFKPLPRKAKKVEAEEHEVQQPQYALEISPSAETVPSSEAALIIKGSRVFSFSSKNIEGTKEGFLPGVSREESLRVNIAGKIQETEVDANFFSTSQLGTTQISSREESVSILLKRVSTEAYFGEFTPVMDDLEFCQINKILSGLRIKGDYEKWGFNLLASSPKGEPRRKRMYGDTTSGPYSLGASPVIINSEQIYVDNILQKRGNDYEIDYQAGTITFKYKTIKTISVIEATFDFRETIFHHSTYAGRLKALPFPNLLLGGTFIDDSDSLKDAGSLSLTSSREPQSHQIIGVDGALSLGEAAMIQGEAAYSEKKPNLLTQSEAKERGLAAKTDISSNVGPLRFLGKLKRITPKFAPIEASPKQDLTEYSTLLGLDLSGLIIAEGGAEKSSYTQFGSKYETAKYTGKAKLQPKSLPSTEYVWSKFRDSNDPVTASPINRLTIRDSLEFQHSIGIGRASLKGERETRTNTTPISESTVYRIINAALSISPSEYFQAAGNAEYKRTSFPEGLETTTKTYSINTSAAPKKEYLLTGSLHLTDDSQDGIAQVTDVSYKAEPVSQLKTTGKYTVRAVKETFGSTSEGVRKEEGSINFEVRPFNQLRLRYYYKPNMTLLNRSQGITFSNIQDQIEANIFVLSETMLGYSNQNGASFQADKSDYPLYKRKQNSANSRTTIYTVKTAPLRFLSCEFNYILDDGGALTLQSATLESYGQTNSSGSEINAAVKTSLSERVAIDGSFRRKKEKSGTGSLIDNTANTLSQSGSLKVIFNATDSFTLSPSYAYSQSTNFLLTSNRETYTIQPGVNLILRVENKLRVDGTLTYAKSHAGSSAEKTNLTIRGKYDVSDYVHILLRLDSETSRNPDYKTSEFSGNVEINL